MAICKTSELIGPALDWAVAKCEGAKNLRENPHRFDKRLIIKIAGRTSYMHELRFSTDWSQGGPIIEREDCLPTRYYGAAHSRGKVYQCHLGAGTYMQGSTPLIAAMRCYVASKLGDEVEIPEELA